MGMRAKKEVGGTAKKEVEGRAKGVEEMAPAKREVPSWVGSLKRPPKALRTPGPRTRSLSPRPKAFRKTFVSSTSTSYTSTVRKESFSTKRI